MRSKLRLIFASILAAASLLVFSACLNPVSLDNYAYVATIGVDPGKEYKYDITLELQGENFSNADEISSGASILSDEGDTLFEVINKLYQRLPTELNFSRTNVFVFNKEIAESGAIEEFFTLSLDKLRIRSSSMVVISDCSAREFLGGRMANNDQNINRVHENIYRDALISGNVAVDSVASLYEACSGGRFDVGLSYCFFDSEIITDAKQRDEASQGNNPIGDSKSERIGGMQIYVGGAAIFDGWKMVGTFDFVDTQYLSLASGEFGTGSIAVPLDEGRTVVFAELDEHKTSVDIKDDKVTGEISITLSISLEQDPTGNMGAQWDGKYKDEMEKFFETELKRVFSRCRDLNSDAIGIGKEVSKKFTSAAEWEAFDWKNKYQDCELTFDVELILSDYYIAVTRE